MNRILVVEDEFAIADLLAATLEDEGYHATLAGNGREGLLQIAESRPDMIISDIMMPIMDGREMVRTIRADHTLDTIPILVLSAVGESSSLKEFVNIYVMNKPFDLNAFVDLIEKLLKPSV
jgi:DNA-binding response OmpR family regulator